MSHPQAVPGAHTLTEILSQPGCWRECLDVLHGGELDRVRKHIRDDAEWLFIGCGSSYYAALAAAASWTALTGSSAKAVPASELLLFPDLVLGGKVDRQPVVISRSGRTSEALRAAGMLESRFQMPTLAISCAAEGPLEQIASVTMRLSPADESSTVMTRSFTSMLLGLQVLAATVGQKGSFSAALEGLRTPAQAALDGMLARIDDLVQRQKFANYVFLAQGPLYGLAAEGRLKVTEMSCSYAQAYHTLEFRHGPKSIVGPESLLTFLISESAYGAELEVLEEMKGYGATTLVVTNRAEERARRCADLLLELNLPVPELARLGTYAFVGQLLGYYTGLHKNLDPDNPRNLSRVVVLE
ncbi:MAG TPA: SIS domain-containing protein [Acidobacteriota bacterium]|nr:SIS domain-containing protein [Acidobacteriota bacterium]